MEKPRKCVLIDYGLGTGWKNGKTGMHIKDDKKGQKGTFRYMSVV